jgi:hypothetical protein
LVPEDRLKSELQTTASMTVRLGYGGVADKRGKRKEKCANARIRECVNE